MAMKAVNAEGTAGSDPLGAAALFHALAEPSRLTILEHLLLGEHRVVDLVAHLGLAQSTVSQHLGCLRDCGLVSPRAVGRSSYYSVTDAARIRRLLDDAVRLLEATGGAATGHDGAH